MRDGVEWLGQLPREEVLREMEQHDVLCMPSLHEGFGLVLLEALSRSLPVIATVNTGAPDIIRDGVEGFIIPIQSSEAIQERLLMLAEDRDRLEMMSASARECALRNCWSTYDLRLLEAVASFSNG
jgi:glycosyltransferase involved in cell wall biosynthesis